MKVCFIPFKWWLPPALSLLLCGLAYNSLGAPHIKKGDPHGVPVEVVSISIEKNNPKDTELFVKATGAKLVLSDPDAALLEEWGGDATPFLVVVDGTKGSKAQPSTNSDQGGGGLPVTRQAELALETLRSSDVRITSTELTYNQKRGGNDWKLGVTRRSLELDYRPFRAFDFLGFDERVAEDYYAVQMGMKQDLGERLKASGGLGGYRGFPDFRSFWLAHYYKQQFEFVPGYEVPNPEGFQANAGMRWEYRKTTGFLEVGYRYANDTIAPGYEIDLGTGDLGRGRRFLHTHAPSIRFENVLTPRIRMLQEFQLGRTSGRDPRYGYQGSVNIALFEKWFWRTSGGYTQEDPTLKAWFVGNTLEYAMAEQWLISISALYYKDSGEIENSLFVSTAAPGLQTRQIGLNLRYAGDQSSFLISAGPVQADYEPASGGTRPFTHLYRDRTWLLAQLAWSYHF